MEGDRKVSTNYGIDVTNKRVTVEFSEPMNNLAMPVPEALRMASILLLLAKELDPASVEGWVWPEMEQRLGQQGKPS